jgi:HMG (high mobility group) box
MRVHVCVCQPAAKCPSPARGSKHYSRGREALCATLAGMCIQLLLARVMNAYRVFADENRAAAKAQLQAEGQGAGMGQVAKILGAQWRALGEEAKKVYLDKAAAAAEVKVRACVRASGSCTEHARHTQLQAAAAAAAPDGGATQAAEDTYVCGCLPPALWSWGSLTRCTHPAAGRRVTDPCCL